MAPDPTWVRIRSVESMERHAHDLIVECGDVMDRVTVPCGPDCIWCKSTAEDRARVVFVTPVASFTGIGR